MAKKYTKITPTWDLYLVSGGVTKQLIRNAEENLLLDKYFTGVLNNINKHPDITNEELISSYKELWSRKGELRSFYTDSWGHKWVCFPSDKKMNKFLNNKRNEITSK